MTDHTRVQIPVGTKDFILQNVQTGSVVHTAHCKKALGVFIQG
jgi:hypothetical protein